ncbi:restriction endonuclease S subunit [Desulfosporosinus orientis DSM 765]|uniref:Restriction endonuclease S subunit n=1 Tax=Desulfosporosinus orientis (strain ATCC 19365 / DSM 765 / NCIMB 8382 / VKM B-1628 / Singapore I) TaxID=768706 RepID=G7WD70_DESOD|nr:restriction endonuclease subunit S [Desulfosporosinus orientis]AET67555.1 restriction endonuclease S subunit [Desulfosporosinus orientis DSM 765]
MSENKENVPKIRFPGFTDAWEQRKLGELYAERNEPGYDSLQILSVSIHHGISNEELDSNTLGKKVRRSEDKSLYKHVYFGDLVLNMMRAWQGAIGVVKSEGMVSPAYITAIPSAELYPLFMDYCLRRDEEIIQMNNLSYGVTDFRKRLYWDSFINILCCIPSETEQERITAFFTQLDNYIILHQRKLNNVKNLKAGLLQKMFPKDGEGFPEVRFPGFTDAWEQRKLGKVAERIVRKNKNLESTLPLTISSLYGLVDQITYFNKRVASKDVSNYYLVKRGEFAYNKSYSDGFPWGSIKRLDRYEMGVLSTLYIVFALNEGIVNSDYLVSYYDTDNWHKEVAVRAAEGARNHGLLNISADDFFDTELKFPKDLAEQAQIGEFFKVLDSLITLHQRKLEHLQEQKKALMQQMFV